MNAINVIQEIVDKDITIRALGFYVYKPQENVSELLDKPFISRLLYHDSPTGKEVWVNREEILSTNKTSVMIGDLEQGTVLAVISKIRLGKNKIAHIPMMDFYNKKEGKEQTLGDIRSFLERVGHKGVILHSGRSFHFYGNFLMNETEWMSFLGDCMLSGLADPRYIAHNLKDGYGILRITACSPLRPMFPKVVSLVE
ncbi:hypothetical protein ACFLYY_01625 [Patescibacteria group bacterium]